MFVFVCAALEMNTFTAFLRSGCEDSAIEEASTDFDARCLGPIHTQAQQETVRIVIFRINN